MDAVITRNRLPALYCSLSIRLPLKVYVSLFKAVWATALQSSPLELGIFRVSLETYPETTAIKRT